MSDRDNITLPREVVQEALEALEFAEKNHGGDDCYADSIAALRAALAAEPTKHPGYIIGSHWLETAYSRVCAGEAEADVLRDCGWERVDEALRRDAERLWEALKHYGKHDDDCGDHDAYNSESLRHCGCGLDAVLDETLGEKR